MRRSLRKGSEERQQIVACNGLKDLGTAHHTHESREHTGCQFAHEHDRGPSRNRFDNHDVHVKRLSWDGRSQHDKTKSIDTKRKNQGPVCALGNAFTRLAKITRHGRAGQDATYGRE